MLSEGLCSQEIRAQAVTHHSDRVKVSENILEFYQDRKDKKSLMRGHRWGSRKDADRTLAAQMHSFQPERRCSMWAWSRTKSCERPELPREVWPHKASRDSHVPRDIKAGNFMNGLSNLFGVAGQGGMGFQAQHPSVMLIFFRIMRKGAYTVAFLSLSYLFPWSEWRWAKNSPLDLDSNPWSWVPCMIYFLGHSCAHTVSLSLFPGSFFCA